MLPLIIFCSNREKAHERQLAQRDHPQRAWSTSESRSPVRSDFTVFNNCAFISFRFLGHGYVILNYWTLTVVVRLLDNNALSGELPPEIANTATLQIMWVVVDLVSALLWWRLNGLILKTLSWKWVCWEDETHSPIIELKFLSSNMLSFTVPFIGKPNSIP